MPHFSKKQEKIERIAAKQGDERRLEKSGLLCWSSIMQTTGKDKQFK
ncbi:hypothetical protein HYT84_02445 [Candidatus Micrarchaeota archaeon]|nr:hypothetical protein [Candidatus Micrarchaeota archaeon]